MNSILRILDNTDQPIASYVWRVWLIAHLPSLVVSAILTLALALPSNMVPPPGEPRAFWILAAVIISPWAETLLMWPILRILKEVGKNTLSIALVSALIWGYIHSRFALGWSLIVIWPFFILSMCFLEWEKKSTMKAITVTGFVHTCLNMVPVALELLAGLAGVKT